MIGAVLALVLELTKVHDFHILNPEGRGHGDGLDIGILITVSVTFYAVLRFLVASLFRADPVTVLLRQLQQQVGQRQQFSTLNTLAQLVLRLRSSGDRGRMLELAGSVRQIAQLPEYTGLGPAMLDDLAGYLQAMGMDGEATSCSELAGRLGGNSPKPGPGAGVTGSP